MQYTVNLVDVLGVLIAAVCFKEALPDLRGTPRKIWRLGVPPLLGNVVSLVILAGAVTNLQRDVTWISTVAIGMGAGILRGRKVALQTDQMWGTVRISVVYDAVIAAFCILIIALGDGASGLFAPGTLPRHADMAAASALFSGYLAGRAVMLVHRAVTSQHTDL